MKRDKSFKDLTLTSFPYPRSKGMCLRIGWLNNESSFSTVDPAEDFLDKLWSFSRLYLFPRRSILLCNIGETPQDRALSSPILEWKSGLLKVGFSEFIVFGENEKTYLCPSWLFHYVRHHKYQPPQEFIHAVLNGPALGSAEFVERFNKHKLKHFWFYPDLRGNRDQDPLINKFKA